MGRTSGYLALRAGIICGAEMVLIPEVETPVEEVTSTVNDAYLRGKAHCIIVVAEGFKPTTTDLAKMINDLDLGFSTRVTILGHIQRGGKPTAFDRMLSTRFGVKAVEFLLEGTTSAMVAMVGREMEPVALKRVTSKRPVTPQEYLRIAKMLAR
jgi:6-phosphofructokinase 1